MRIRVDAGQLARSRFTLSQLVELTCGLEVLVHPRRAPHTRRWVHRNRSKLDASRIDVLLGLTDHDSWYVPDFLVRVPNEYEPSFDDELDLVAATPAETVRWELTKTFRIGPPPVEALERSGAAPGVDPRAPLPSAVADVLARGGETALATCVVQQLRHLWQVAMAGSWSALRRVLDEDVRQRAAHASRVGFAELLTDLHPRMRWDGDQVVIDTTTDLCVDADPGVVVTPSVFLPRPALWLGTPGQALVGYPANGRGQVWSTPRMTSGGTSLLGIRKTALLADLATPRSTAELAVRHELSPATVSYHVVSLHRSGLLTRRQDGHAALYQRTPRAETLLTALDATATA